MDWDLESGGTHFPSSTTASPEAGQNLLLLFLLLGLIWLAMKVCEWLRGRASRYYSAASVRQRQERREELAQIEQQRRDRADERRREQRERQADREREAQ